MIVRFGPPRLPPAELEELLAAVRDQRVWLGVVPSTLALLSFPTLLFRPHELARLSGHYVYEYLCARLPGSSPERPVFAGAPRWLHCEDASSFGEGPQPMESQQRRHRDG